MNPISCYKTLGCIFRLVLRIGFICIIFNVNVNDSTALELNNISIFTENFGNKSDPAILLNAGAGNQSIFWPNEFCEKLSKKGYFIIRYDYRDTGLSTAIDYHKNPYNVKDFAEDAIGVLKKLDIKKAHFVGFSMGGQIAQIMAAYHSGYVHKLVLIGTSTDFESGFKAFEGKPTENALSPPNPKYIKWLTKNTYTISYTLEDKVNKYVLLWKQLDGSPKDFDEEFYRIQGRENYTRTLLWYPYINHSKAMKASYELHRHAPYLIDVPTLIIHGKKDPIFGIDHAKDLNSKIKSSNLIIWDDFAHAISPKNFTQIINAIDDFIKRK